MEALEACVSDRGWVNPNPHASCTLAGTPPGRMHEYCGLLLRGCPMFLAQCQQTARMCRDKEAHPAGQAGFAAAAGLFVVVAAMVVAVARARRAEK